MNADVLLVGLGNPGQRYSFTRHNVGFIYLDLLANQERSQFSSNGLAKKINAEICDLHFAGKKCLLIKPQTYMNLSGESLAKLFQEHRHLREAELVVLHDEADVPFGKVKIKFGGGDAGHNGLKSIRSELGTGDYIRIRMGVGKPPQGSPISLADYVLHPFQRDEEEKLQSLLQNTHQVLETTLSQGIEKAQRLG